MKFELIMKLKLIIMKLKLKLGVIIIVNPNITMSLTNFKKTIIMLVNNYKIIKLNL